MHILDRAAAKAAKALLLLSASALFFACGSAQKIGGAPDRERLADGVYSASYGKWPNIACVRVRIASGRIEDVKVKGAFASWIGYRANGVIPARIVEKQSTDVDALSGATNSSHVIMNAVQRAVEKSYKKAGAAGNTKAE